MNRFKRFLLLIIAIFMFLFALFIFQPFSYKLNDQYQRASDYGAIRFLFISVSEYDSLELEKLALHINDSIFKLDTNRLNIVVSQFYILGDTVSPSKQDIEKIHTQFPDNLNLIDKLDCYHSAYSYYGFSREVEDINLPQNKLINSTIFVPKQGYKAKEIMKN